MRECYKKHGGSSSISVLNIQDPPSKLSVVFCVSGSGGRLEKRRELSVFLAYARERKRKSARRESGGRREK